MLRQIKKKKTKIVEELITNKQMQINRFMVLVVNKTITLKTGKFCDHCCRPNRVGEIIYEQL